MKTAWAILSLLGSVSLAPAAQAQALYEFGSSYTDEAPEGFAGGIIRDANGVLYGPAYGVVTDPTQRVVYALTPPTSGTGPYTASILHYFGVTPGDGNQPTGPLLLGQAGVLYGTTQFGGATGSGTFYMLSPPASGQTAWTETVLYSFFGDEPADGVIAGPNGSFFGLTNVSVFQLLPPASGQTAWTEQVLHSFPASASDGTEPSSLAFDAAGNLYGTAYDGGPYACGCGIVFELTPPQAGQTGWTEKVLYAFNDDSRGKHPAGIVQANDGVLFGAATEGGDVEQCNGYCGAVYGLAPPTTPGAAWRYKVLHRFTYLPDGAEPLGITLDRAGNLYGNTIYGGVAARGLCRDGCGTIYELKKPPGGQGTWTETVIASPGANIGYLPEGPFIGTDNKLYDVAQGGTSSQGVAFSLPRNLSDR